MSYTHTRKQTEKDLEGVPNVYIGHFWGGGQGTGTSMARKYFLTKHVYILLD